MNVVLWLEDKRDFTDKVRFAQSALDVVARLGLQSMLVIEDDKTVLALLFCDNQSVVSERDLFANSLVQLKLLAAN